MLTFEYLDGTVARLWHRDRAKLDTFSTNVHRYLQNHKNCIFEPPYDGKFQAVNRENISALFESFNAQKVCSRVLSRECQFYS